MRSYLNFQVALKQNCIKQDLLYSSKLIAFLCLSKLFHSRNLFGALNIANHNSPLPNPPTLHVGGHMYVHLLAWSWHFIACLWLLSPGFDPLPLNAGFVVDKSSLGQILLLVVQFSSVSFHQFSVFIHLSSMLYNQRNWQHVWITYIILQGSLNNAMVYCKPVCAKYVF